jgi:23S rRNA pseudouridine2605 synthase
MGSLSKNALFPLSPIVCYQGFMRENKGKDYPRRGRTAASPLAARTPQMHPKKPKGRKPARKDFTDTHAAGHPPPLRHKPAPGNGSQREPTFSHRAQTDSEGNGSRIAKVMARAGLCSRREAEGWIGEGRVALNGVVLTNPAVNVRPEDTIIVDGKALVQRARTRLFLFHKPRGLVTTERDPEGRATVFDFLREHWPDGPRVVSIGRLDINTEGLLLLTNDGGLARVLELPATGWVRRYRVRVNGEADQLVLDKLRDGLTLDGVNYAGIEATLDRVQGANSWLTMALREGKNREIKRVLEHLGLYVNRLIRLSFGPFQLGEIAEGAVEEVRTRVLRDQLGPALAEQAGADFLSPLENEKEVAEIVEAQQPRPAPRPRRRSEESQPARPPRRSEDREPAQPRRTQNPRAAKPRLSDRQVETRVAAKVKPPPRPRKHISALRADDGEGRGPRKRVERRETADRAGRTVYVERLVTTRPANKSQEKPQVKPQEKRRATTRPGKDRPLEGRGSGFVEERGARPGRQGPKSHNDPRASGQKGKMERGRGGGGHPTPRGQTPRHPRGKS